MVLKGSQNLVKTMLSDTILALCKNTLQYEGEFCVEGLLGITLDNNEIFLVNINETIQKEGYAAAKKREREAQKAKDSGSGESSSQDSDSESQGEPRAKRKKKKRRRSKDNDTKPSHDAKVDNGGGESNDGPSDIDDNEDSRLSHGQTDLGEDSAMSEDRLQNIKTERMDRDDEDSGDIVFVKEEPHDDSYKQNFPNLSGTDSQNFGSADPSLGLSQLQDLAMQLSGDMSQPGPSNMIPSSPYSSFQGTPGGASDQVYSRMRLPLDIDRRPQYAHTNSGMDQTPQDLRVFNHKPSSIESHQPARLNTPDKMYSCLRCGKKFRQSAALKHHERTHTGEKPYMCKICGKSFGRSHVLKDHMRTHTGERPYKCDSCGWAFSHKCNLKSHTLTCKARLTQFSGAVPVQNVPVQSSSMP